MLKAITYLNNPEVIFLATNLDERFPWGENMVLPGTGSLVQTVITGSRRKPIVVGKPEKYMFEAVQKQFPNILPERTLMIGDKWVLHCIISDYSQSKVEEMQKLPWVVQI